jgi:hypothetical protein
VSAAHSLDDGMASVGKDISAFNKVDIALATMFTWSLRGPMAYLFCPNRAILY